MAIELLDRMNGNHLVAMMVGFESSGDGYLGAVEDVHSFRVFFSMKDLKFHSDWNWIRYAYKKTEEIPELHFMFYKKTMGPLLEFDTENMFLGLVDCATCYFENKIKAKFIDT